MNAFSENWCHVIRRLFSFAFRKAFLKVVAAFDKYNSVCSSWSSAAGKIIILINRNCNVEELTNLRKINIWMHSQMMVLT